MPQEPQLRILITNVGIANRTGTEIVVMDLARAYHAAGHAPMVWAPVIDRSLVAGLDRLGIPAVERFADLPAAPDIIHGHNHLETIEALRFFEKSRAIFVVHSGYWWHDEPPRHPRIAYYVAVDEFCRERIARLSWIAPDRIRMIQNAVDLERFRPRPPLPPAPKRALVFSNYVKPGGQLDSVAAACRSRGIDVDTLGSGTGNLSLSPEAILSGYDVVFGKARCALEALAAGCAVILFDMTGLGGMVTSADLAHQRAWNFGIRLLTRPPCAEAIGAELDRYDPIDAAAVTAAIRSEVGLERAAERYLALYRSALDCPPQRSAPDWHPLTERIQVEHQARIRLALRGVPRRAAPGQHFDVSVRLRNRSPLVLATAAPWPCLLMYRWIDAQSGAMVVEHGFRSILQPPSFPGTKGDWRLRVIAPESNGRYILRVTMIQEGWRWLDSLEPPVYASAKIQVSA